MSRPAPVSSYDSARAFRLRYLWQVLGNYAGTAGGSVCISPFSGIDCTRFCNKHLPECPCILFWRSPALPGIFFRIRSFSGDITYGEVGFHYRNERIEKLLHDAEVDYYLSFEQVSDEIANFNPDLYYQNPDYLEWSYREGKLLD